MSFAGQVSLPPSAELELTRQDASKNGAMLFELSSAGRHTHAGVLDFTAPEGTLRIPPAVAHNLWGPRTLAAGQDVSVTYKRLQRGEFLTQINSIICARLRTLEQDWLLPVGVGFYGMCSLLGAQECRGTTASAHACFF